MMLRGDLVHVPQGTILLADRDEIYRIDDEHQLRNLNEQGILTEGLDKKHRFSKLTIDKGATGTDIVVIGDPVTIETTLNKRNYVLKG